MLKVGIVGMGVIGTHIARAIVNGIPGVALAGVTVRTQAQAALRDFAPSVLGAGKHLMVLSVGGLVGTLEEWARLAEKHGAEP